MCRACQRKNTKKTNMFLPQKSDISKDQSSLRFLCRTLKRCSNYRGGRVQPNTFTLTVKAEMFGLIEVGNTPT